MTPEERAEKLYQSWCEVDTPATEFRDRLRKEIAAQIREAVEEAFQHQVSEEIPKYFRKGFAEGKAEAYEDAAKRIEASVNIEGIGKPSVEIINCHLQSKHDAAICRARAKEIKKK